MSTLLYGVEVSEGKVLTSFGQFTGAGRKFESVLRNSVLRDYE